MDEYIVGSIADLISNKNALKVKSKKKKLKVNNNNESQSTVNLGKNDKTTDKTSGVKTAEDGRYSVSGCSLKNFADEKEHSDTPGKSIECGNVKVKIETRTKKRIKLNMIDNEEESRYKKPKRDILEEDYVPTDHESNEDESMQENSKVNKWFLKNHNETRSLNENTLFVGNIPVTYDKKKICKVFSKFGEIQNARIRCVPIADMNMSKKVAAIKKHFNPKRKSLVAYINFKSQESAQAAVKANGMVIDGHHLRLDFADNKKERDNNKAVFVGGLPFDTEDDELWEFFQNCGKINAVRIIRDSQTSMGKGFGYVNFDSAASVELALQLNGQELKKRAINVKRCTNSGNKHKLNSFGRKRDKDVANQMLCRRNLRREKKFNEEKLKLKKNKKFSSDFQGRTASMTQRQKKKLSKAALRQRKLVKILGAT